MVKTTKLWFSAEKNINNTPHEYNLIDTEEKIAELVKNYSAKRNML